MNNRSTINPGRALTAPGAILFDMDGTLTQPRLDFDQIRRDMGVTGPILEALARLPLAERITAQRILHDHEDCAASESTLNSGCRELLAWLDEAGIMTALVTRNSRKSVDTVFHRHGLTIDICVTREDGKFKPDPAPLHSACQRLKIRPADAWMVGDSYHDIEAGIAAPMRTIWICHGKPRTFTAVPTEVVEDLNELRSLIEASAKWRGQGAK